VNIKITLSVDGFKDVFFIFKKTEKDSLIPYITGCFDDSKKIFIEKIKLELEGME